VTPSQDVGATFDPQWHEALAVVPARNEGASNRVVEVIKSGYLLDGELLRPAAVAVAQ
jgi:molecular chaperone GrpE